MKQPSLPRATGIPGVQKIISQTSQLPPKRRRQLTAQAPKSTNLFSNLGSLAKNALKG